MFLAILSEYRNIVAQFVKYFGRTQDGLIANTRKKLNQIIKI